MQSQGLSPQVCNLIGGERNSRKRFLKRFYHFLPFSLQFTLFSPQFVDLSLGKPWYQYFCCSESQSRQKSSFCLAEIMSKWSPNKVWINPEPIKRPLQASYIHSSDKTKAHLASSGKLIIKYFRCRETQLKVVGFLTWLISQNSSWQCIFPHLRYWWWFQLGRSGQSP